jgi:hypothetical protein
MAAKKKQIEVLECEKVEGKPEKAINDKAGPGGEGEVGGRGVGVYTHCPWCWSIRFVDLDYEGESFICGNCGHSYRVYA